MKLFKVLSGHKVANKVYSTGSFIISHKDLVASWGVALFEFIKDLPDGGDGDVPVPESSPPKEPIKKIVAIAKKKMGRPKKSKVVEEVQPSPIDETPPEDTQGE